MRRVECRILLTEVVAERLPPSRHCKFALASPLEVSEDVFDNRHAGIVSTRTRIIDLLLK